MAARSGYQKGYRHTRKSKSSRATKKHFVIKSLQGDKREIKLLPERYNDIDSQKLEKFADIPLCTKTQTGLLEAEYEVPTEIQRETIGLALQGKDILGAAKTGSGKTLAFLIPILECLFRNRWSAIDGLGALIISPTRELALQTYEVLCKIGKKHDFSAGLVIGGKDLKEESERIHRTNIIVCTPGRMLQHMDETSYFECSNLLMLVLDEADRILDLGFEKTMNAIIENLPSERQTLLFSATQTKSVRDLARLSLQSPVYVSVHKHHEFSTPAQLEQSYVVCALDQKMNMLYSFIRNHLKKKTLVFLASCKQVKYTYEVFCRLRPGITVMALYGKLHQLRRVAIYKEFCQKKNAVLLATDIAARGLDFPAIDWVIQLDCPEDVNTYIHRAGRTARYNDDGESLLVLLPSEETHMVPKLKERKIPIENIRINTDKLIQVQAKLQAICAKNFELKQSAQRCFISYLRSVYLMSDKEVFDIYQLPSEKYAFSLGLAIAPRIRFLQKAEKMKQKAKIEEKVTQPRIESEDNPELASDSKSKSDSESDSKSKSDSESDSGESDSESEQRSQGDVSLEEKTDFNLGDDVDDSDLLMVKRTDVFGIKSKTDVDKELQEEDSDEDETSSLQGEKKTAEEVDELESVALIKAEERAQRRKLKEDKLNKLTNAARAKKLAKKKYKVNQKVVFDDDGEIAQQFPPVQRTIADLDEDEGGIDIEKRKALMQAEDKHDRAAFKQRIRDKHRAEKLKKKEQRKVKSRKEELSGDDDDGVIMEDTFDWSLLPDPDKKYDSEENDTDDSDSSPTKKRKMGKDSSPDQSGVSESDEESDSHLGNDLRNEEELALQLLTTYR
ncbi:putative ATP-dependent RNA helicase DDX10 [Glandiceps talaboti]